MRRLTTLASALIFGLSCIMFASNAHALDSTAQITGNSSFINPQWGYRFNGAFPVYEKNDETFLGSSTYDLSENGTGFTSQTGFNTVADGSYGVSNTGYLSELDLPSNNTTINGYNPKDNAVTSLWVKNASMNASTGVIYTMDTYNEIHKGSGTDQWVLRMWSATVYDLTFTADLDDGDWHHIAIVEDSVGGHKRVTVYVDGTSAASITFTSGVHDASRTWTNGNIYFGQPLGGSYQIDEFVYGSGAPTATDVYNYYQEVIDLLTTPTYSSNLYVDDYDVA